MKSNPSIFVNARHRLLEQIVVPFFLLAARSGGRQSEHNKHLIDHIRDQHLTILVIDDDDDFRKSLCFKLRRIFGAQVDDVNSGKLALANLSAGKNYDLIFTDIMMPEMTGLETYQELKRIDPQLRIVIMSAYSDSEEWQKAQTLKTVLLHKPIVPDVLIKVLTELTEV